MELSNLLQSREWEEFEKALGQPTFWIDDVLLVKNRVQGEMGYFYCPRGPKEITRSFLEKAVKLANEERVIFIRMEPLSFFNPSDFKGFTFVKSIDLNPANTLVLNLNKDQDKLLSEMKQKTRYNLNLAVKKGVSVEVTSDPGKIEIFYNLMKETSARDKFGAHTLRHYKKQVETLGPKGIIKLYLAKYEGRYIAANMVSFFGNTVSYHHGASSNEYRNVMAPYLLQWEAILDAKKEGYRYYDFWGIAPHDDPRHKWAGVTRFKKGLGGEPLNFPGTWDLVINKKLYFLYKVFRALNRMIPR